MGFSEKTLPHHQMEGLLVESAAEAKKWVIAGIPARCPLKPIRTNPVEKKEGVEEEECSTPTAQESRIPSKLKCPPAPRKRKTSSKCNFSGVSREFFTPPDLESVFIRRLEKA